MLELLQGQGMNVETLGVVRALVLPFRAVDVTAGDVNAVVPTSDMRVLLSWLTRVCLAVIVSPRNILRRCGREEVFRTGLMLVDVLTIRPSVIVLAFILLNVSVTNHRGERVGLSLRERSSGAWATGDKGDDL
jgi:hypothetical protein